MPSLRDVARELNVSISLVSKVLNDRLGTTGVRPEVIEQIQSTAAKLGYRKNFSALSLLSRRQNTIAVFVHTHGAEGSGLVEKLLDGIARTASTTSQKIYLEFFSNAGDFRAKRENLHSGRVDGLIVSGVPHPELVDDLLKIQEEVPVVTVYNEPLHRALVNVGIPHADLAECATSHLIAQGCRRIAHFAVWSERLIGYRRALRRAGLPFRRELVVSLAPPEGFELAAGKTAVARLLKSGVSFDGVSAQSDTQAVGALNELCRRGISVPQEVKIVGIDNAPFGKLCYVPLSSVSQRFVERGRLALVTLNQILAGQKTASIRVDPVLHARDSTRLASA